MPFKSGSVLLPLPPPFLTELAFTHAHVIRGRELKDAARVDTVKRIRLACTALQVNWLILCGRKGLWKGQYSGPTDSFVPGRRRLPQFV